jgi:hypothetical protein
MLKNILLYFKYSFSGEDVEESTNVPAKNFTEAQVS